MRLYRLAKFDSIDDLALGDAESPRPARGQVAVRMRATSLNYRDLMVVGGRYAPRRAAAPIWCRCRTAPAKSLRSAPT